MANIPNSNTWTPCEGKFPIIAATTFTDEGDATKEGMRLVEQCGFNTIIDYPTSTWHENTNGLNDLPAEETNRYYFNNILGILRMLDTMEGTNLKVILSALQFSSSNFNTSNVSADDSIDTPYNPHTEKEWQQSITKREVVKLLVNRFKNNPRIAGWNLADEPRSIFFNKLKDYYDEIKYHDNNHLILINLNGTNHKYFTNIEPDSGKSEIQIYEEFVNNYTNIINPTILCYDLYPISHKIEGASDSMDDGFPPLIDYIKVYWEWFYNDLELYNKIVKERKNTNSHITFWTYIQSTSFLSASTLAPDATEEYLRYAVFSALAYGAQGLIYFTYAQRRNNTSEAFRSAPVDTEGNLLPQWHYVKKINEEIRGYSYIFLGCTTKCMHTGKTAFFDAATTVERLSGSFGPIETVKDSYSNDGFLFADITNGSNKYLMVVNHSSFVGQTLKLTFSSNYNHVPITPNKPLNTITNPNELSTLIPPGGYIIYQYQKK